MLFPVFLPGAPMDLPNPPADVLTGAWRLVCYEVEIQATGGRLTPMGEHPSGYVMFSPCGRVWFMLTAQDRPVNDPARLLDTMIAYSGRYEVEQSDWITHVDVAWDPAWVGTQQRRRFQFEDALLRVSTPWRVMPNWAEHGMTRSIITFARDHSMFDAPRAPA